MSIMRALLHRLFLGPVREGTVMLHLYSPPQPRTDGKPVWSLIIQGDDGRIGQIDEAHDIHALYPIGSAYREKA